MSPHLFDELRIFGELEILHAMLPLNASVPSSCDLSAILNGGTALQFQTELEQSDYWARFIWPIHGWEGWRGHEPEFGH